MAYKNDRTKNRRRYKSRYRSAHTYKAKHSSSQTKAAVLVSVITFLVIASVVIIFTFGDSIYAILDNTLTTVTATQAQTQAPTQAPTVAPTQAPTQPPVKQDEQFMQLLEQNSLTLDKLKGTQMIFVDADESTLTCTVYCYEKGEDSVWTQVLGPYSGYIGAEGISELVSPTEYKTPVGVFKIEYAFGTADNPGSGLEYTKVDVQDRWIIDPNSINYNRWVTGTENQDWESAQWLYEYIITYPHAIVFDYNRDPVDKTQGCAKFIHVSSEPTKGGIGIAQSEVASILYWLNPSKSPYVAIAK